MNLKLNETDLMVLQVITLNPTITVEEVAGTTYICRNHATRVVRKLRDAELIERVGGNFGGYWKINKRELR